MSELAFMFQILRTDWPGWERSERAASRIFSQMCERVWPCLSVFARLSASLENPIKRLCEAGVL